MGEVETFAEVCATARRTYSGLKAFFASEVACAAAAKHLVEEPVATGGLIVGPATQDRDLRFVARGAAIVTVTVGDAKPESVRTVEAPVSLGAAPFALGTARGASVVAWKPCSVLRLSPAAFRTIGQEAPSVAVGLLHWAAMDLVDWLRDTRSGTDTWSRRHDVRGHEERVFEPEEPGRERLQVDADVQAAAVDALQQVTCMKGVSLLPFAQVLGQEVHLHVVERGGALVSHDERDGSLYLLLEGTARVMGRSGRPLATFRAGGPVQEAFLGEVSFFTQLGRDGTVTAETDCLLLEIPRRAIPWMITKHPELAVRLHLALLKVLCWRLIEADEERERLAGGLGS